MLRLMMWNVLLVTLLLIATHHGHAAEISIPLYYITEPDTFTGPGGHSSECFILSIPPLVGCDSTSQSLRLTDNVTGLGEDTASNTDRFIGWDTSGKQTFTLAARLDERGFVQQFDIYFYNNPTMKIGLPTVSLVEASYLSPVVNKIGPLLFTYGGNQYLTVHDQNVTMISIIVTSNYEEDYIQAFDYIIVTFNFSSQLIRQALVSEIKIFNESVSSETRTSITFQPGPDRTEFTTSLDSIMLTCTVDNEGLFLWHWTGPNRAAPDTSRSSVLTADLTRTSILWLTNVSHSDTGEYICRVQTTLIGGIEIEGFTTVILYAAPTSTPTPLTNVKPIVMQLSEPDVGYNVNVIISCILILAAALIMAIVLLVIACTKHHKRRRVLYLENPSHIYATVEKQSIPFGETSKPATSVSHPSIIAHDKGEQEIKPDRSPLLFHSYIKPIKLQQKPTHEEHTGINTHHILAPSSLTGSLPHIFAEPESPPVPAFHGTPSTSEVRLYDEDLSPEMFKNPSSSSLIEEGKTLFPFSSIYAEITPIEKPNHILDVEEANIREISELGVGRFGQISLVHTVGLPLKKLKSGTPNKNYNILVVVKRLASDADEETRDAFEKEIKFMSRLQHKNVIRLIGVSRSTSTFMMMEYMDGGDLNIFLQDMELSLSPSLPPAGNSIALPTLMNITLQIASGMRYLASLHYVHRDLAARNCLVRQGGDLTIKIADFGMSRNLYQSHYYQIKGTAVLPIRWMARECFYGRFSEKSDVWAFGVTMWEIFTLCKIQPYEEMSDQEVIDSAVSTSDFTLLSQPDHCPDEIYQLMEKCWIAKQDKRIRFNEAHVQLSLVVGDCS